MQYNGPKYYNILTTVNIIKMKLYQLTEDGHMRKLQILGLLLLQKKKI